MLSKFIAKVIEGKKKRKQTKVILSMRLSSEALSREGLKVRSPTLRHTNHDIVTKNLDLLA